MSHADWPEVVLGSYCTRITVGHVGPMADRYVSVGTPFLRSQDITPFRIDMDGVKFIDDAFKAELRKSQLRAGDVAIVRTGYPGTAAVVPPELDGANCADLVILTPGPNLDPWFVAGLFNSAWGKGQVGGMLVGVAQQHFNVGAAKAMRVRLPPLPQQQAVGTIIRAYSDLIHVNQQRIAILEEMARRVFDEWFVRFRFPGHEDSGLTDGVLGPAPPGWGVEKAATVMRYVGGGTPSKSEGAYWEGGTVHWFTPTDLTKAGQVFLDQSALRITEIGLSKSSARRFPAFSIMMTSRATLGVFAINTEPATTNQGFITFMPTACLPLYFLYHLLRQELPRMVAVSSGATFKEITKGALGELNFLIPPQPLVDRFERIVEPMMRDILVVSRANSRLRDARGMLLPKLISGEIVVGAAERALEDAA